MERQLKQKESTLTPETVIDILQSIYEIELAIPDRNEKITRTILLTEEHRTLAKLFNF